MLTTHWTPQVIDAMSSDELARWGNILEPFYIDGRDDKNRVTTFEVEPMKTARRLFGF